MTKVVYEKVGSSIETIDDARARELLGWQEEGKLNKWAEWLLKDSKGNKIRCNKNVKNRPLYKTEYTILKQEILRKRWKLNGEPIIVSAAGNILNGQHTLVALILACQEYRKHPDKWIEFWDKEPTIDKVITVGIDDSPEVIRTIDRAKPQSLTDVIYRSDYFPKSGIQEQRILANMAEGAVRVLWFRTGASVDAFSTKRTVSEAMDFLQRHPGILRCVSTIHGIHGRTKKLKAYLPPGWCAGLMYLMASCTTDAKAYRLADTQDETHIKWDHYEQAKRFFMLLSQNDDDTVAIRNHLESLREAGRSQQVDQPAVLVKAWAAYIERKPITAKAVALVYKNNKDGFQVLTECPIVGGLDVGQPSDVDEALVKAIDPSPEEIKAKAKELRPKETPPPVKIKTKSKKQSMLGRVMWVKVDGDDPWQGKIVSVIEDHAVLKVSQGFQGTGSRRTVPLTSLTEKQPIPASAG